MVNGRIIILSFLLVLSHACMAQFVINAGPDKIVCPGAGEVLGGAPTAFGGLPPYTFLWQPSTSLSSASNENPLCSPTSSITYTVTVTDDTGAVKSDVVTVTINALNDVTAGDDVSICENSDAVIGSFSNPSGVAYSWSPASTLNDSTYSSPTAHPGLTTTTYTLTATVDGCSAKTDQVTVTVIPTPPINAGEDVYIKEGERAILTASGGHYYAWGNGPSLRYIYSINCDAEPIETTTYYLYGMDETGTCPGYDQVTVFVEPDEEVVIYNTFTPNGDGENDHWYIGNIQKYPDNHLEVYNRYGKLVYKTSEYMNTWDGKVSGEEIPAGTYFYDLDLGNGKGKRHGTLTIIR
jgi:gliding motility-associated-like protein